MITSALVRLGFTPLEAEAYLTLAQESPLTGYRIAQLLGRPAANVYKAIEALERKGAVIVEGGASRLCRAVSIDEVLSQAERQFRDARDQAAAELADLRRGKNDERIYHLRSVDQVIERSRQMIAAAREVVLVDVFPQLLSAVRDDLEAAAARGINVSVAVYEPAVIAGVDVSLQARGEEIHQRWPGAWLNVSVDGLETLLALTTPEADGVLQAVWSASAFLSAIFFSGMSAELMLADVEARLAANDSIETIRDAIALHRKHFFVESAGFDSLADRFANANVARLRVAPRRRTK